MSLSADDLIFEVLGQGRALPGVTAAQVVREAVRALGPECWPLLDAHDVAYRLRRALEERRPLALILLGRAETLLLAQGTILSPQQVREQGAFLLPPGMPIPDFQARRDILDAIADADLIGLPLQRGDLDQPLCAAACAAAGLRLDPARLAGAQIARQLWQEGLLPELLAGRRVLVIGGTAAPLADVLAGHGVQVAGVIGPVRGSRDVPPVLERCREVDFDIALVAAGVSSCILCTRIRRQRGRVAVGLGAWVDGAAGGLPWPAPAATAGPVAEPLQRALSAGVDADPSHVVWNREAGASEGGAVWTARFERGGAIGRWSVVLQAAADRHGAAWEAAVLGLVPALGSVRLPRLFAAQGRYLAVEALTGTPLPAAGDRGWHRTVAALAAFHCRSRALRRQVAPQRRWQPLAAALRVGRLLQAVSESGDWLPPEHRALPGDLAAALPDGARDLRETTLVHGDLRPERVLVPDAADDPVAVTGWGQAREHVPAADLVPLLQGLPAGPRGSLLEGYARARADQGWPCAAGTAAPEYAAVARLQLTESLARVLLQEATGAGPPPPHRAEALVEALDALPRP